MRSGVIREHEPSSHAAPSPDGRHLTGSPTASSDAAPTPSSRHALQPDDRLSAILRGAVDQRALLQRNKKSAKLLTELARPKPKPGPAVPVQKALVKKLDTDYADVFAGGLVNLGGILIDEIPESDADLIRDAQLTALPLMKQGSPYRYISAGQVRAAKIKELGFDRMVVENTLRTMIDAKQIEYLRLAGLPNDEWKILIEVHYYRERDMTATGFHKDTLGQTLFVNLNYHMDKQVIGPEIVVNPPRSKEHTRQIKESLPEEFRKDLKATRDKLGDPTEYEAALVDEYGYVAFVDEAVHHATPFHGHRHVTGDDLKQYLQTTDPAKYAAASIAYPKYVGRGLFYYLSSFASYDDSGTISAAESAKWYARMQIVADDANKKKRFTRVDLKAAMTDDEFDDLLEAVAVAKPTERTQGAAAGFYAASIPGSKEQPAIKPAGKRPLKRRLSNADFRKTLPAAPAPDEKRRFFRTWVRVVPKDMADELPRRLQAEAAAERLREQERAQREQEQAEREKQAQKATSELVETTL